MKTMEFYEPAMCCPTGLCGVNVDPELLRVAVALEYLKKNGIIVNRYNLSSAPQAFVMNKVVAAELQASGMDSLPLIVLDGKIVLKKRYPTNEEMAEFLGVPMECLTSENCCGDGSCCCGDSEEKESDCCCGDSAESDCCCGESEEESGCCGGDDDDNGGGCCCCGGGCC